jgi:hypothetical protein
MRRHLIGDTEAARYLKEFGDLVGSLLVGASKIFGPWAKFVTCGFLSKFASGSVPSAEKGHRLSASPLTTG